MPRIGVGASYNIRARLSVGCRRERVGISENTRRGVQSVAPPRVHLMADSPFVRGSENNDQRRVVGLREGSG